MKIRRRESRKQRGRKKRTSCSRTFPFYRALQMLLYCKCSDITMKQPNALAGSLITAVSAALRADPSNSHRNECTREEQAINI